MNLSRFLHSWFYCDYVAPLTESKQTKNATNFIIESLKLIWQEDFSPILYSKMSGRICEDNFLSLGSEYSTYRKDIYVLPQK